MGYDLYYLCTLIRKSTLGRDTRRTIAVILTSLISSENRRDLRKL